MSNEFQAISTIFLTLASLYCVLVAFNPGESGVYGMIFWMLVAIWSAVLACGVSLWKTG